MAGRSDIEAGRAYVELYVKNNPLVAGLRATMGAVTQFVGGVAAIMAAAGAAAAAMTRQFINAGSELNDMAARTGVAATQLQHLKFAAEQTGASISDVEIALRTMARKGLGTDIEAVGARIAAIPDPAQRAAAAMEAFGKSGTKLLPMFAEWKNLKAASEALGPVLTEEEVRLADELGDKFGALSEAMSRAMLQIGAELGPHLKSILDGAIGMVVKFNRSLQETNAAGQGGDWLDKAAEFLRTPLSEFVATGAAVPNAPRGAGGMPAGDDADPAKRREKADTHEEIMRNINRGYQQRAALILETETAEERFLRKEREIFAAINAANRNRVTGFVSEEESRAQMQGLQIALARVRAAEAERRAALRPKIEAPKVAPPEPVLPDKQELLRNVAVGFTATGLLAAGGGGRDATVAELKLVRKEQAETNRLLAEANRKERAARAG